MSDATTRQGAGDEEEDVPYIIRGGVAGRERLRVLSRVLAPTTNELLDRIGVAADARCLDVGCGGGDVTAVLAARAPHGHVVGIDVDDTTLALCREEAQAAGLANVSFRHEDVTQPGPADERFDVVYARFLLTHLVEPAKAVLALAGRLAPGGVLVVEDIDFGAHFCHPYSAAFWTYVTVYSEAARARGCDPDIGPRLPGLLLDAGLRDLGVRVFQHVGVGTDRDSKRVTPMTLEAIAPAALAEGLIGAPQLRHAIDDLYAFAEAEHTVLSMPRMVQAWGRVEG
jgi:SAM-dependent methyltransferase